MSRSITINRWICSCTIKFKYHFNIRRSIHSISTSFHKFYHTTYSLIENIKLLAIYSQSAMTEYRGIYILSTKLAKHISREFCTNDYFLPHHFSKLPCFRQVKPKLFAFHTSWSQIKLSCGFYILCFCIYEISFCYSSARLEPLLKEIFTEITQQSNINKRETGYDFINFLQFSCFFFTLVCCKHNFRIFCNDP